MNGGRIARRSRSRWTTAGLLVAFVCVVVVAGAVWVTAVVARRGSASTPHGAASGRANVVVAHGTRPTVSQSALGATLAPAPMPPGGGGFPMGPSAGRAMSAAQVGSTVPLAESFVRTTSDATTVRVYRADVSPPTISGPPWWAPQAQCFPSGLVQADVSNDAIAGVRQAYVYPPKRDDSVRGRAAIVGVAERHPEWVVTVQAPSNAASVRAVFPSGRSDSMTPVDAGAVLVASASANDQQAIVKVEAVGADGAVIGSVSLNGSAPQPPYLNGVSVGECTPPTQLPPPGVQQPADPASAKRAISGVAERGWGPGETDAERFASFDDAHGFGALGGHGVGEDANAESRFGHTGPEEIRRTSDRDAQATGAVRVEELAGHRGTSPPLHRCRRERQIPRSWACRRSVRSRPRSRSSRAGLQRVRMLASRPVGAGGNSRGHCAYGALRHWYTTAAPVAASVAASASVQSVSRHSTPSANPAGRCREAARTSKPMHASRVVRARPTWPTPNTTCSSRVTA